jgi:hypothetical protein
MKSNMKKYILCLFLFVLVQSLFAQHSKISVFSENGEKFWVVINGIRQNSKAQTNVKVEGLDQPNYRLRVIFEDDKIAPVDKSIMTTDVDNNPTFCTYVLRKDKKGVMQMKVNSYMPLEEDKKQNSRPDQEVVQYHADEIPSGRQDVDMNISGISAGVQISEYGSENEKAREQDLTGRSGENVGVNFQVADPVSGENVGLNMNVSVTGMDAGTSVKGSASQKKTGNQNGRELKEETARQEPAVGKSGNCRNPVPASSLNSMKASLQKQAFEDTRLKMAKDIIRRNCYTSAQIKELLGLFAFEKNKLDLAKSAYSSCTDKDNYYQINDVFSFSSSTDELTEFLNQK